MAGSDPYRYTILMILSDRDILAALTTGDLVITSFRPERLKPGSYGLTLGNQVWRPKDQGVIDARRPQVAYDEIEIFPDTGYVLNPGDFILAQAQESLSLSRNLAAVSDTRSTLARLGLQVILSSSFIEPGQKESHETMEIVNHGPQPVQIFPGMPVMKVIFHQLKTPASFDYAAIGSYGRQNKPYPRW